MQTYLRFTRQEFEAISHACRHTELTEEVFPALKDFLVGSLREALPDLARRLAGFRKYQIGIIYQYLRERRGAEAVRAGQSRGGVFSAEEFEAIARACRDLPLRARFLSYVRDLLLHHFRRAAPDLAVKLGGLSDRQFESLCERVKEREQWRA